MCNIAWRHDVQRQVHTRNLRKTNICEHICPGYVHTKFDFPGPNRLRVACNGIAQVTPAGSMTLDARCSTSRCVTSCAVTSSVECHGSGWCNLRYTIACHAQTVWARKVKLSVHVARTYMLTNIRLPQIPCLDLTLRVMTSCDVAHQGSLKVRLPHISLKKRHPYIECCEAPCESIFENF